jgi:hypothetical protein
MMSRLPLFLAASFSLAAICHAAGLADAKHPLSPSAPRTVVIVDSETPPVVRAGLLQSTLILLPAEEKVATVFGGDTSSWVFDGGHVASRFISIKPKIAGSSTDVHIVSDHGNEYTLQLREVSQDGDSHFDSKVFVTPGDQPSGKQPKPAPRKLRSGKQRRPRLRHTGASIRASSTSITPGTAKRRACWDWKKCGATTSSPICVANFRRRRFSTRPRTAKVRSSTGITVTACTRCPKPFFRAI